MLTINSHAVEISIAGCVEKMLPDPNPMSFLFYFIFIFYVLFKLLCFIRHLGAKTKCSGSYGKEKPR